MKLPGIDREVPGLSPGHLRVEHGEEIKSNPEGGPRAQVEAGCNSASGRPRSLLRGRSSALVAEPEN